MLNLNNTHVLLCSEWWQQPSSFLDVQAGEPTATSSYTVDGGGKRAIGVDEANTHGSEDAEKTADDPNE